jgi:predicted MFS family arabinose efflux permease
MGVYSMIFNGAIPIGALLAGAVAEHIGAPITAMICAGILLVYALLAWVLLPDIRRQA